ncbi:MAG TPA: alkaline phosphatase family protein [Bryobacteraceae bacterium]|nr:alkaline phosphatase family protein [Bryobacteraceae bacterium]
MKKTLFGLAIFASLSCLRAQAPAAAAPQARPKLLLMIAVDQFRFDYLTRFRNEYNAGLAQLLRQGAVFTNANYEHMPTITAVGHATMLTGASPSMSGIIGNDWYERDTGKLTTSVEDTGSELLGGDGVGSTPKRLLVSTVADEIKMAARGESKTIGISLKDRSAILLPGRMADASYWFAEENGSWVTSTWYMKQLPKWVADVNARRPADQFLGKSWVPLAGGAPLAKMSTTPDTMFYSAVEGSPYGNDILEEFAELAIENEKLGQHAGIDVLTVSFSSNDKIGHAHGPDSAQAHDVSVRTDRVLGKLFAYLDKKIGMKNVLVALTADHGVAPMPEVNTARKMPGGRIKEKEMTDALETKLNEKFGVGKWVAAKKGEQVFLSPTLLEQHGAARVRETAAAVLRNFAHVNRVYTKEQLVNGQTMQDKVGKRLVNGYHASRGADLVIVLDPYWIYGTTSTTHGSPFGYDTHVPIILMGPGVKAGRYHTAAAVNDIAPTLATILEVEVPSGSMGRVLAEALVH